MLTLSEEKERAATDPLSQIFAKHRHLYPRLTVCCGLSAAMVFQLAGKGQLLNAANMVGFKGVVFSGDGNWLYDVANGVPPCDVSRRTCL